MNSTKVKAGKSCIALAGLKALWMEPWKINKLAAEIRKLLQVINGSLGAKDELKLI